MNHIIQRAYFFKFYPFFSRLLLLSIGLEQESTDSLEVDLTASQVHIEQYNMNCVYSCREYLRL
jgi:hypothetical protein